MIPRRSRIKREEKRKEAFAPVTRAVFTYMIRELICIGCPMGCPLKVEYEDGEVLGVTGNTCKNGEIYGRNEVLHPMRTLTTTVRLANREEMLPVKTASPVPKEKLFDCMKEVADLTVSAPVRIGDVLAENIAGTGVALVAAKNAD